MATKKQGEAGAEALEDYHQDITNQNVKNLKLAIKYYKDNKIPIIKSELAAKAGISPATIYREPYVSIIKSYLEEEKISISPKGKKEFVTLLRENESLKHEVKKLKEENQRLLKEINYSKNLFS